MPGIKQICLCVLLTLHLAGQSQDYIQGARSAIKHGQYSKAVEYFLQAKNIDQNEEALQELGEAYFQLNDLPKTIMNLTKSKNLGNNSPQLYFRMAQVQQHRHEFEEAAFFYKEFLKTTSEDDPDLKLAIRELKNCMFALTQDAEQDKILVQNFDETSNTALDEIRPIQSPQYGNVFYYSTNGINGNLDINSSYINQKGQWQSDTIFNNKFSTRSEETIHDISSDGKCMIFDTRDANRKDKRYYVSNFRDGKRYIIPLPEQTFAGAEDIQILDDRSLVFASHILPGAGGYDLFIIEYRNGTWSKAVNLGPKINSPYDERTPFLSADRKKIYFSSNKPYCFGGFDIYYYNFDSDDLEHLNEPVNGTGNDLGFRFQSDNQMAIFYSDRKSGVGGYDIYFTYLEESKSFTDNDSLSLAFVDDYHIQRKIQKEIMNSKEKEDRRNQETEKNEISGRDKEKASEVVEEKKPAEKVMENFEEKVPQTEEQIKRIKEGSSDYMIFYQDKYDLTHGENKKELDKILGVLNSRNLNVRIIAHTDYLEPGLPEYVQYNSLKRTQVIADYFIGKGLHSRRISLESVANNFPVAKNQIAGTPNRDYLFYNRRIDFELYNNNNETLIAPDFYSIDLPAFASDRKHVLYNDIREELYYSIWIGASKRMFKNAILRLFQDIFIRRESYNDLNNYYCGLFTSYEEAKSQMKLMETKANIEYKIVAFHNGHIINNDEAKQLEDSYPDLYNYINRVD